VAHVASAELERPGQRLALLVALAERRLKDRFLSRSGRFYAWGIALSYALAMWMELGEPTWLRCRALGTLAWVSGGMVVLSALRNPDDAGERGLLALVRRRGASAGELATAQLLGLALRLLRVMAWPALVLAVAAGLVTRDGSPPLVLLLNTLAVLVFVAATSVALVLAARAALILGPGRVKLTFAALVLLPHLAHAIWPSVPSIPAVLEELLDAVTRWSTAA
jgi:hypothetical protein